MYLLSCVPILNCIILNLSLHWRGVVDYSHEHISIVLLTCWIKHILSRNIILCYWILSCVVFSIVDACTYFRSNVMWIGKTWGKKFLEMNRIGIIIKLHRLQLAKTVTEKLNGDGRFQENINKEWWFLKRWDVNMRKNHSKINRNKFNGF